MKPHYICDACHDFGYVETGGDQTQPCPRCNQNGYHS